MKKLPPSGNEERGSARQGRSEMALWSTRKMYWGGGEFFSGQRKPSEGSITDTNELFSSKDTSIGNSLNNNVPHCNSVT